MLTSNEVYINDLQNHIETFPTSFHDAKIRRISDINVKTANKNVKNDTFNI